MYFFRCLAAILFGTFASISTSAHPLGDFLSFKNDLYWVYVCPIQSSSHQACVMKLDKDGRISEWQRASKGASDWILSRSVDNQLYLIERYYSNGEEQHFSKMYKQEGGKIKELTDWYKDTHRIGESGFVVLDNKDIVFAHRGKLKLKTIDGEVRDWSKYTNYVQKFRVLRDGTLLLIQKKGISQIDVQGNVLKQWRSLIQRQEGNPPLMGNRIFDADYHEGALYIAYWGNRRFEAITIDGKRSVLKQYDVKGPWIPHSISFHKASVFGLASHLMGQKPGEIYPELTEFRETNGKVIWTR